MLAPEMICPDPIQFELFATDMTGIYCFPSTVLLPEMPDSVALGIVGCLAV